MKSKIFSGAVVLGASLLTLIALNNERPWNWPFAITYCLLIFAMILLRIFGVRKYTTAGTILIVLLAMAMIILPLYAERTLVYKAYVVMLLMVAWLILMREKRYSEIGELKGLVYGLIFGFAAHATFSRVWSAVTVFCVAYALFYYLEQLEARSEIEKQRENYLENP